MGDQELMHENCVLHSGQEERIKGIGGKLNLVIWLLGFLITIIIALGGALYASVQTLNVTLASFTAKFVAIEGKIQTLEATDARLTDRIDRLEHRQ